MAKKTQETTAKFQEREFPIKIGAVIRKSEDILSRFSRASKEEKAKARKALSAALRVKRRLGLGKKSQSSKDSKKKGFLKGVKALVGFGKKVAGAPGELERRLDKANKRRE